MPDIIDSYKTISQKSKGFFKDKNSKFYSFAYRVNNEQEIKEILASLRKEYHDARHHCYAWCLEADKSKHRTNDDGEPSNSAGTPILNQIYSFNLTHILVVVIRYFGGTKLGIPGLINAYKTATGDALGNAEIITVKIKEYFRINFTYVQTNAVMKIIRDNQIEIIDQNFDTSCCINLGIELKYVAESLKKFSLISDLKLSKLND